MAKEILYTTAEDENGVLVHIDDVEKGKVYKCPSCKNDLILKKSGKTGKGSKRPHFAHNELTPNCNPETVLHYSFKRMTVDLLNKYLSEKKELTINWNCPTCSKNSRGNLLAKVGSIKEEYNLKECQPDIALLDTENNVVAVIEIVVTHKPTEKTIQYFQSNNIILIQVNLTSDEDLKIIGRKITTPDIVNYCHNPQCSDYSRFSITRNILYYPDRCSKCYNPIEKYNIIIDSALGKQRSLDFTEYEISLVRLNRNNNIVVNTDQSTKEKYPTSNCIKCSRMNTRRHFRF